VAVVVVSAAIGEQLDAAIIGVIVILNALLGFLQEAGAERKVLALREAVERRVAVVRDGQEVEVSAEDIVPGDLMVLREGDGVAADGRLVAARGLEVDESALTGESVPVAKGGDPVAAQVPLAERCSMVFAGTGITRGRARAVVTTTGDATEIGAVAALTARAKPPRTPFQRRLGELARVMVVLGVGITLFLGGAMLARGSALDDAFLVGVSVAVAAVPEGLVATLTVTLALGGRAMARRGAIVRRLRAVETLGSATVIASDKTGTLTQNRLRLAAVWALPGEVEERVLAAAVLASTAEIVDRSDGPAAVGDPVEGALLLAARDRGLDPGDLVPEGSVLAEIPFDPERRAPRSRTRTDDACVSSRRGRRRSSATSRALPRRRARRSRSRRGRGRRTDSAFSRSPSDSLRTAVSQTTRSSTRSCDCSASSPFTIRSALRPPAPCATRSRPASTSAS